MATAGLARQARFHTELSIPNGKGFQDDLNLTHTFPSAQARDKLESSISLASVSVLLFVIPGDQELEASCL